MGKSISDENDGKGKDQELQSGWIMAPKRDMAEEEVGGAFQGIMVLPRSMNLTLKTIESDWILWGGRLHNLTYSFRISFCSNVGLLITENQGWAKGDHKKATVMPWHPGKTKARQCSWKDEVIKSELLRLYWVRKRVGYCSNCFQVTFRKCLSKCHLLGEVTSNHPI